MSAVRKPAVAGQFYPGSRARLESEIADCFVRPLGPGRPPEVASAAMASPALLMVPHAGYVYSGHVAAWGYLAAAPLGRPEVVLLLGPNHRGLTQRNTIDVEGSWETPLGLSPVAEDYARRIAEGTRQLTVEPSAGRQEHSLEVQLPFLQTLYGLETPFIPIMVSTRSLEVVREIAEVIAAVAPRSTLVISSTDMTHFASAEEAKRLDAWALKAVEALDADALVAVVASRGISMCGYMATALGIEAATGLGVAECRVLRYATSGDVSGDKSSVVAYASAIAV